MVVTSIVPHCIRFTHHAVCTKSVLHSYASACSVLQMHHYKRLGQVNYAKQHDEVLVIARARFWLDKIVWKVVKCQNQNSFPQVFIRLLSRSTKSSKSGRHSLETMDWCKFSAIHPTGVQEICLHHNQTVRKIDFSSWTDKKFINVNVQPTFYQLSSVNERKHMQPSVCGLFANYKSPQNWRFQGIHSTLSPLEIQL